MTDSPATLLFKSLGYSGRDSRHITVRVFPCVEIEGGALKSRWKVHIGNDNGDLEACIATDYIFASSDPDWEFFEFELGGKTWPGLAIHPIDSDFEVEFGKSGPQSIILKDQCGTFNMHRYQLVLRNKTTGEFAICDPGAGNGGQEIP